MVETGQNESVAFRTEGKRRVFGYLFLLLRNLNFIDTDEFEALTSTYYNNYHDRNMDISSYIRELPYLDRDGNPVTDKQ